MSAATLGGAHAATPGPARTPQSGLALAFGAVFVVLAAIALASSFWLRAGPFESGLAALDRGDEGVVTAMLAEAARRPLPAGRVVPLVDLALATGDTDRAIALLEQFLRQQPGHVAALRRLVDVHEQIGRSQALAAALEELHRLTGEVEHLRRASEVFEALGLAGDHERALARLVEAGVADAHEALTLAGLRLVAGDPPAAFRILLRTLHADAGDMAVQSLSLAAVVAVSLPDPAAALAALGTAGAEPRAVAAAARELLERQQPLAARSLLSALPPEAQDAAEILPVLLLAEMQTDRDLASRRMARLQATGRLPAQMAPNLVILAAEAGRIEEAIRLAASLPAEVVPPSLAPWLLERLSAVGGTALLSTLALGALAADPLLAAAAAIERNARHEATVALRRATEAPPELPGQLALLAGMLRRMDLTRVSFATVLEAVRRYEAQPGQAALLPLLAETPQQSAAALVVLRAARDRMPGAAAPWAVLAAQQGQGREVLAWLPAASLPVDALLTIQAAALVRRDQLLAEAAGRAVVERYQTLPSGWSREEVALRGALAGPLTEALLLRALDHLAVQQGDAAERMVWLLAGHPELAAAIRFNGRVTNHLALAGLPPSPSTTFLLAVLAPTRATDLPARAAADPARFGPLLVAARFRTEGEAAGMVALRDLLGRLPVERREASVHASIAYGNGSTAAMERAAAEVLGGNWAFNVMGRLERSGQRGPLLTALRARAADARLPRQERLAAAARLGEMNDREGAGGALRALAEGQAPDSIEVRQLVHLWGPAGRMEALTWTERRAREAPAAQRGAWLAHLEYLGGTQPGLRLLADWRDSLASDPALARAAASLFYRAGRAAGAEPLLTPAIAVARDPAILAALGQAAEAAALPRLALAAYARALEQRPNEATWRLAAARAAASSHRPGDAAQHYRALVSNGRPEVEILLEAGDALRAVRETASARRLYAEALERAGTDRLRARLLARLDRGREAEALLTRLSAVAPNDPELRAEVLELRAR